MDPDLLTCGSCGAHNAASARWCSQCYAPLGASASDTVDVEPSSDQTENATVHDQDVSSEATAPATPPAERMWTCSVCAADVSIDFTSCTVCGTEMFVSFGSHESVIAPDVALRAGLIPGGGLMKANHPVEGVMVLFVTLFSVVFGLPIISVGGVGGWALVAIGIGLWAAAVRDGYAAVTDPTQMVLSTRVILGAATAAIIIGMLLVFRGFPTDAVLNRNSLGSRIG